MKNRLVLIDGVNFFYKGAWGGTTQLSIRGEDVTYIYAFMRNLVSLIRKFEEDENDLNVKFAICWDGGYNERMRISSEAVQKGLIPKTYKQERREAREVEDEEQKKLNEEFKRQMNRVKELVAFTKLGSVFIRGEEADDLIGSLVMSNKDKFDEIILVTSDRDYYQLFYPNVKMYNSSKHEFRDIEYLKAEYNLDTPEQWVEVGALAGESGKSSDTIYGVPGISYITGSKLIAQYKTLDNLYKETKIGLADDLNKFNNDAMALYKAVKDKTYKLKQFKKELSVLAYKEIVEIAKQLKQIRTWLDIPFPQGNAHFSDLTNAFSDMSFQMGTRDLDLLCYDKGTDIPMPF